jgi:L-lysine 2,3-aminomutase
MDNRQFYNEVLDLYEQYKSLNFQYAKLNIMKYMKNKGIKRKLLLEVLNIDYISFNNMLNVSINTLIPFDILISLYIYFKINLEDLNSPISRESKIRTKRQRWTKENIEDFMKDMENMTIDKVTEKWNLKIRSAQTKYGELQRRMK